jgi:hypothetical protein
VRHPLRLARVVLLGPEHSSATHVGTGRAAIVGLTGLAVLLNVLDLVSGVRLMLHYGTQAEQNLIARTLFEISGPLGLAAVKLGVVGGGVLALMYLARNGRTRLARNSLVLIAIVGLLGLSSNLV